MITNKLGLKIVRTSQGYGDGLEVNGEQEWTKNVRDVREDLKYIENLHGDESVLMLTCVDGGNLLTIASLIDGRITDCISAWIYIPSELIVPGKNLVDVIEITRNQILAVERNDELLKNKFDKTYEIAPAKRISQRAVGNKYAYRYYGGKGRDYQLWELLNEIHQPYYQHYKSVFLIEKSSQLSCSTGDDLSEEILYTSILANVPNKVNGFEPYINGNVFNSPMYVSKGENIEIIWKKDGYESIKTISKATKEDFIYEEPTVNQYMRLIPFETIKVVDERNRPIEQYSLRINHRVVEPGGFASVNEAALDNVRIDVNANGYEPKGGPANFKQHGSCIVKLVKTSFEYKLAIPLKNEDGYIGLETITTNHILEKSPIAGYEPDKGHFSRHNTTYLRYAPYNKAFWIKTAIVLLVVLICGISLGAWMWNQISSTEVSSLKAENSQLRTEIDGLRSKGGRHYEPQKEEEKVSSQGSDVYEAIQYLDDNNVWNRTKMEAFPDIKGLWDAMNKYDFNFILALEEKLGQSETFMDIVNAIKLKEKTFTGSYNNEGDFNITIHQAGNTPGYVKTISAPKVSGQSDASSNKSNKNKNNKNDQNNW